MAGKEYREGYDRRVQAGRSDAKSGSVQSTERAFLKYIGSASTGGAYHLGFLAGYPKGVSQEKHGR